MLRWIFPVSHSSLVSVSWAVMRRNGGGFIGEDAGDAGATFEFLADAFQRFGGAQTFLMVGGEG